MNDPEQSPIPVQEPPIEADAMSALSSVKAYQRSERAAELATACTHGMGVTEAEVEHAYSEMLGE